MKSLTLHTHRCLKASLRTFSFPSFLMAILQFSNDRLKCGEIVRPLLLLSCDTHDMEQKSISENQFHKKMDW